MSIILFVNGAAVSWMGQRPIKTLYGQVYNYMFHVHLHRYNTFALKMSSDFTNINAHFRILYSNKECLIYIPVYQFNLILR